jgi:hypothetical protein
VTLDEFFKQASARAYESMRDERDALRESLHAERARSEQLSEEVERLRSLIEISPPLAKQTELLNERNRLQEQLRIYAEETLNNLTKLEKP